MGHASFWFKQCLTPKQALKSTFHWKRNCEQEWFVLFFKREKTTLLKKREKTIQALGEQEKPSKPTECLIYYCFEINFLC